jgi:nucleotide-binding universal stress UspA family protein
MLTWSKILCAIDFSQASRVALEDAADLAKRLGAALTLIHVREPPLPLDEAALSARDLAEADAREIQGKLETWRAEAERLAGRPVDVLLVHGASGLEIVEAARRGGHDVVVTGSHARKGIRRVLLGSVAEKIVREAPCTVLVAREAPDRDDPP